MAIPYVHSMISIGGPGQIRRFNIGGGDASAFGSARLGRLAAAFMHQFR
jgi:hypothetical protein